MPEPVQDFIANKDFPRAIAALLAQAQARPHLRRPRLRLADVYIMAGRASEAVPVLWTLADQFASDGFVAKAIALLKRIEKIDPGRREVESQLAQLIQKKSRRTVSIPRPRLPVMSTSGMAFGLEEINLSDEIQLGDANTNSPAPPDKARQPSLAAPGAKTPGPVSAPAAFDPVPEFDASFVVDSGSDDEEAPPKEDLSTPLFDGLSPEELVAVMRGLELVSFEPGDLIVGEGEVGDSMFILTSGKVKVYVRTPSGKSTKVGELDDGDFFGEISVLTGKPRTATVTAAEPCDCLELTSTALDGITTLHPVVRDVLKKFQEERAMSTVQAIMADRD